MVVLTNIPRNTNKPQMPNFSEATFCQSCLTAHIFVVEANLKVSKTKQVK